LAQVLLFLFFLGFNFIMGSGASSAQEAQKVLEKTGEERDAAVAELQQKWDNREKELSDLKEELEKKNKIVAVSMPGSDRRPSARSKLKAFREPLLSKGLGFTHEEREAHGLEGLMPNVVETIEHQAKRWKLMLDELSEPINKYSLLNQLQSTDVALFYKLIIDNLVEMMPIIYTPTVGEACMKFDRIFRQSFGLHLCYWSHKGRIAELLNNWPFAVDLIVVTDGGRILGLGDLGTNGMGIPMGKCALYVAGGGFNPMCSLPVQLDCGTDNQTLINDEFYMGAKKPRISAEEHAVFLDEFCCAVKAKWPRCLIQFEDFATERAFALLEAQRHKCLSFNDDIQGTGSVVLAGFINGMRAQGTSMNDARVVFYGAGSSAVGVSMYISKYIAMETGKSEEEAKKCVFMLDTKGLVTTTRGDTLPAHKQLFARADGTPDMKTLSEVIAHVKPHALFGLSGGGPAFDETVIKAMCESTPRPLIFPLSNPTSKAEVTAENAYKWSNGQCYFAAGSPFAPVEYEGKTLTPGQGNNVFIFPGVGFGAWLVGCSEVHDEYLIIAARVLAQYVPEDDVKAGTLYPNLGDLRDISAKVATGVCKYALANGHGQIRSTSLCGTTPDMPEPSTADLEKYVCEQMYDPSYNSSKSSPKL